MLLFICTIQGYAKIIHFCMQRSKLAISMYAHDFEVTLQVQLVDLFNSIFNIIYFQIFNHTSCGKDNVLGYGLQEANAIYVYEVTSQGDFLVFIKNTLGEIWYHDRFHILNLVTECFALKILHTGSIDFLSYPDIFQKNQEVLQDVIINCMQYSIYFLASDVLESPWEISPL